MLWMSDQVRHDDLEIFYETLKRDGMRLLIHLTDEKPQNSSTLPLVLVTRSDRHIKAVVKTMMNEIKAL